MTLQSGNDVVLKIGNGSEPESFAPVGGLRNTNFMMNSQLVDSTNITSQGWRAVLNQAGKRSVTVSGDGFFSDSAAERTMRDTAFARTIRNYQIAFGNGSVMSGAFKIRSYGRYGKFREEESYKITLESSGPVTFTDPA